jgi:molybdopterin converting factor small subunit
MIITVKSYASMKKYLGPLPAGGEFEIPEGTPVGAVLKQLGVPPEIDKIILVNGRHRPENYPLRAGDTLVFFPPLEGG